jgi:hypothetical protein
MDGADVCVCSLIFGVVVGGMRVQTFALVVHWLAVAAVLQVPLPVPRVSVPARRFSSCPRRCTSLSLSVLSVDGVRRRVWLSECIVLPGAQI